MWNERGDFLIFVIGETKMATVQPSAEFPASVGVYLSRNLSDSRRWGGGGGLGGKVERILLARREWNKNKPGVKSKLFAVVCVHTLSARARSCTYTDAGARDNRELGICVSSSFQRGKC